MLESFSIQAVNIIENAKKQANEFGSDIVGSEHLLIAMYNMPDSICHFLLTELNIKLDDLKNALTSMEVIHKELPNSIFSKKFQEIILNAKDVAKHSKSDYVYDEHIFYSLLELKDSVGFEILESLNIDTKEMLIDIEEIFNFFEEEDEKKNINEPYSFLKLIKKENFNHPYVKQKDYVEQIIYILKKKQKNNPLLIGNAGVGKSAIIEGLSEVLKDELIYELDLGMIVAGTKYRGELEEKLMSAMNYIQNKKAIVFIDEIHNIVGAGSNDGSLDVANILKPYLTKTNIRVIGATTIDEYHKYIVKDKALIRRFQNIYVSEPNQIETLKILKEIKRHYEDYHDVEYSYSLLKEIINKCSIFIPNRSFPDKAIDVLDEVGAISNYRKTKKYRELIDEVIFNINGIKPKNEYQINKARLHYKTLIPYYIRFIKRKKNYNNIVTIAVPKDFHINDLLDDISKVFGVVEECFLELDLEAYNDMTSLNNLIGSSKGYVGYEQGGILLEHINKYPISIIYIKNINLAHISVQAYICKILEKQFVFDNKGRKISFGNTIFIIEQIKQTKTNVGFENNFERNCANKLIRPKTDIELVNII